MEQVETKVDVLAVMDAACCVLAIDKCADPQKQLEQARAAIAELIEVCSLTVDFAWEPGRYALYDKNDNVYGIDRYASEYEAENAREELIRAALARVGGGK